ncbi:MAG: EAL domain-containing protein [Silicimonas sp.]|nr:EAL domain-containing protein [Silicimonas sp.]
MAFQPIVNLETRAVFAQEALLRGVDGAGAGEILATVNDANRYAFDQRCRQTALETATGLKLEHDKTLLSINFLPNAVYEPRACIKLTLEIAEKIGFPIEQIMFEFTEAERIDIEHVLNILHAYRSLGFKTAIDDFGAGFSGLDLLSRFQPDVLKLDMQLIRDIDTSPVKHAMVKHLVGMMQDLGILLVCEGVETQGEFEVLRTLGVDLMQGYFFAKPRIGALADPYWPMDEVA